MDEGVDGEKKCADGMDRRVDGMDQRADAEDERAGEENERVGEEIAVRTAVVVVVWVNSGSSGLALLRLLGSTFLAIALGELRWRLGDSVKVAGTLEARGCL